MVFNFPKAITFFMSMALLLVATPSIGEVRISKVEIPVVGAKCNERVREVSGVWGVLRLPSQSKAQMPAVVLLHSNAGIVGVGDFYAQSLNAAGIATLEVDSFAPRGARNGNDQNAPVLCDRLQDAWGALVFLSKDARINQNQIGVAGFSSGGAVAIMAGMGVRPARLVRGNLILPREGLHKSAPQPPRALSDDETNKPRHHRI